jgi:hypothetical protein
MTESAPRCSSTSVKPAGRGADVDRPPAGHVDAQRVQGVDELRAAARDVGLAGGDLHLDVTGDQLAGLLGLAAPRAEMTSPAMTDAAARCPRREQAALGEQRVEADPGHRGPKPSDGAQCAQAH